MTTDRRRILPAHRVAPFPMADAQEAWLIRATPQILSHRAMECGASAVAELVKMNGGLVPEELVRRSGPPMREVGPVLRGIARVGDELTGDEARAALRGDQTFMELLESQVTSGATFCGPHTSNSPAFTSPPMRPAVDGVASTVRRVRASGAIALAVTP